MSRRMPRSILAAASGTIISLIIAGTLPAAQAADAPPAGESAADLADELAKARARIAELEAEVAALKARLAGAPPTAAPPPTTAPDADPFANPASIRRRLETDYTAQLAEALPAPGDAAAMANFRRELERWVASVNRSYRKPVRWNVRVSRTEPQGDRLRMTLVPLDPASGEPAGDEFIATAESRIARRVAAAARNASGSDPWTLVGTFIPEINARPERMSRGDFDHPPLIGPGAELFWRVEIESLVPERRERPLPVDPAAPSR